MTEQELSTPLAPRMCPVCRATGARPIFRQDFELPTRHPLTGGYDVCLCSRCAFVFADTHIEQEAYDAYYAQQSIYASAVSSGTAITPWERERHESTVRYFEANRISTEASIVDVGCANGGLLLALRERRYLTTLGIDPSQDCVRAVRASGLRAEQGVLNESLAGIGQHDVVCLIGVMEHLQDLDRAIACVAPCVKPGGLLFVEVPDAPAYAQYVVAPFQDFNTEHIRHFSPMTLAFVLERFGFESLGIDHRVIEQAPRVRYPAIRGFFRKGRMPSSAETAARVQAIQYDESLANGITRYIALSKTLMAELESVLTSIAARPGEIWVWGAGQLTMKLLRETPLGSARIRGFIDANPVNHGRLLKGLPILPPSVLAGTQEPIVISSLIHQRVIAKEIREKWQLSNEIVMLPDEHMYQDTSGSERR